MSGFVSVGEGGTWGIAPQVVKLTMACGTGERTKDLGALEACNLLTNAIRDVLAGVDHGDTGGSDQSGGRRAEGGRRGLSGCRASWVTRRATARSRQCVGAFFVVENSIVAQRAAGAVLPSHRAGAV